MILAPGHALRAERGQPFRVVNHLGRGGQGDAYLVQSVTSSTRAVAKIFPNALPETQRRVDWLLAQNFPSRCPALVGPLARLRPEHGLGVLMPYVPGQSLETLFESASFTVQEALIVGAGLCRAVDALEGMGAAHGDLSASNVFVVRSAPGRVRAYLIDLDNVAERSLPPSPMRGQLLYLAPEIASGAERPSITSDRWSLGVVLHELLAGAHPWASLIPRLPDTAAYVDELRDARWVDDPMVAAAGSAATLSLLSPEIHSQFRRTFQPNPWTRASAVSWAQVLEAAIPRVFACDACATQCVNFAGRIGCPGCRERAKSLVLVVAGRRVSLRSMVTTVGRVDVGGDGAVSARHMIFRRFGVGARLRDVSTNGTAVRRGGVWSLVPRGGEVDVGAGDRVLFAAGVEGVIEEESV